MAGIHPYQRTGAESERMTMQTYTMTNEFHGTTATVRVADDGTISKDAYRRARRKLCGISGCRCFGSSASGKSVLPLLQAEDTGDGRVRLNFDA